MSNPSSGDEFLGTWTIFDPGNATWQKRMQFAAKFRIERDAQGQFRLQWMRGVAAELGVPLAVTLVAANQATRSPAMLQVQLSGAGQTLVMSVNPVGVGRVIDIRAAGDPPDNDHADDHPHGPGAKFVKHGGPHGVDG